MNKSVNISVVSPVYGTPELIPELCGRLHESLKSLTEDYEIILIFDCSPDDGWKRIIKECQKDSRVKGIHLSRNFGQHYAITAGLANVCGKWVVVMDCDLQDRPEEIPNLLKEAQKGYDIVFAQRSERKDCPLKCMASRLFYAVFSYMTESNQDPSIANFGIYRREVIHSILSMGDKVRYFPSMAQWVGFRRMDLPVAHSNRGKGKSTYSWQMLFQLALDNMIAFSDKPLRLTIKLGMLLCLFSFGTGSFYFFRYLFGGITVGGFTSLILSIWFLSGVTIFILGVLGVYLGRVFEQTKNRPNYIIQETENFDAC